MATLYAGHQDMRIIAHRREWPARHWARGRLAIAALCAGLLVASCAAPVPPAGVLSGRIDTTAFGEVPAGTPIAIDSTDDTPRSMLLTRLLDNDLTRRGVAVAEGAALILGFRLSATAATKGAGFPDIGLAGVVGSSGTRDLGITIGLPIFGWGRRSSDRYQYVVELTLDERDGNRLWQARAAGLAGTKDVVEIARTVFPALLEYFGRTERGAGLP